MNLTDQSRALVLGFPEDLINVQTLLHGIERYVKLVQNRPVLRPFFDELAECREEYARMQAEGGGVK